MNKDERLQAIKCARELQHVLSDPRSLTAIDVAERFAYGKATAEELREARSAASDASREAVVEAKTLERATSWMLAALEEARDKAASATRVAENASDMVEALERAEDASDMVEALTAEREALRKAEEAEDEALAALDAWRVAWEASEHAWRVVEAADAALAASLYQFL